jgi:pyridoxamine 5'-phosphate oxidase
VTEDFDELTEQLQDLRHRHGDLELGLEDLDPDPLKQFARWMSEAFEAEPGLPNAMTLATADAAGRPSARMVLLKGVDGEGFTFFTNYESRKGRDLSENPHAALVFYWPDLERQVCVRGEVVRLSRAESEEYFHTRPYTSRLGAWVSQQSRVVESRAFLEQRMREFEERFGEDVPLPEHWGGFRLIPVAIEFWKSRANRLHDRFLYERTESAWRITRLAP